MAKKVWVILTDGTASCLVNAVYEDKKEAEGWIRRENKKLGYKAYYLEQSQLIEKKWR